MLWQMVLTAVPLLISSGLVNDDEAQVRVLATIERAEAPLFAMVELTCGYESQGVVGPLFISLDAMTYGAGKSNGSGQAAKSQSEQTLTTTIQDPNNPDEPWVVTSYRRPGESMQAFIRRHREMVESVREALGG